MICYRQIAKINGVFFVVFPMVFLKKYLDTNKFLKKSFIILKNRPCHEIIVHISFCPVLFTALMV